MNNIKRISLYEMLKEQLDALETPNEKFNKLLKLHCDLTKMLDKVIDVLPENSRDILAEKLGITVWK